MNVTPFGMKENFNTLIHTNKPVVVDFYATWCGPCKAQTPVLEEVSRHFGEKARILKIDVDKNPHVAQRFQISSVPTLMVFNMGQTVYRQSGVHTYDQLLKIIGSQLQFAE